MILEYFKQICQIPHVSYHEQAISDYCVSFAKQYGLRYVQDNIGNVVIYKEASKGYETHPTTMLQAHLDMVGAKSTSSSHNFLEDAIELIEEDGWLYANQTTLGADDGVGVAYMLAILADKTLQHPALECVFTVQEEVGLLGALQLDESILSAKKCIGLDCAGEHWTTVSCTGGLMGTIKKHYERNTAYDGQLHIEIKGLLGGHAGIDIAKEHGNAIKIGASLLFELTKVANFGILSIQGGDKNNAIPRECTIVLGIRNSEKNTIVSTLTNITRNFKFMYEDSSPALDIIATYQTMESTATSTEMAKQIAEMLYLLPNGYFHTSPILKDLVLSSNNIGVIASDENSLSIDFYIRSPQPFMIQQVQNGIDIICKNYHSNVSYYNQFPGWNYEKVSPLRELLIEVHQEIYHHGMVFDSTHGGMELGVWKAKLADVDIVNLGPIMENFHSPTERLNIASFERTYLFLVRLLGRI